MGGASHLSNHGTNLCKFAFVIHEFDLTTTRLEEISCSPFGVEVAPKYLSNRHKLDEWTTDRFEGGGLWHHFYHFSQDESEENDSLPLV